MLISMVQRGCNVLTASGLMHTPPRSSVSFHARFTTQSCANIAHFRTHGPNYGLLMPGGKCTSNFFFLYILNNCLLSLNNPNYPLFQINPFKTDHNLQQHNIQPLIFKWRPLRTGMGQQVESIIFFGMGVFHVPNWLHSNNWTLECTLVPSSMIYHHLWGFHERNSNIIY